MRPSLRYHDDDMNLNPHDTVRRCAGPPFLGLLMMPLIWPIGSPSDSQNCFYQTAAFAHVLTTSTSQAGMASNTPQDQLQGDLEAETREFSEKVGLHFIVPSGAGARDVRQGGRDVLMMLDEATPPKWSITFQRLENGQLGETTTSRIDSLLEGLKARNDSATLMERTTLKVRVNGGTETQGFPAELMYLNVPLEGDRVGISGLLIIQTGLSNFLYGTLFAEGQGFEATLKPMLNELYANLRIEPEDTRRELDSKRIASGTQLIELITPDVLRTIATETEPEIYRIYEEGQDGTPNEIGWQRLTARLAPVEAVEGRTPSDVDPRDMGLLITLEGEIVSGFAQSRVTTDTIRRHWISLDRSRERWSVQRTPRRLISTSNRRVESEVGNTQAETGVRTPPQPRATITIIDSEGMRNTLDVPQPPVPYMTQTELYVLGRILKQISLTDEVKADWYVLDRSIPRGDGIRKRQDHIVPADEGRGWRVSTLGPSGTFEQTFDGQGSRLFKKTPIIEGDRLLILEKTDPNRLLELYAEQGIPTR